MANPQNRNASRSAAYRDDPARPAYRTNGAAAYDVRADYRGSAAPEIQRPRLPEERRQPVRRTLRRAKLGFSPFAVFGAAAAACMLVLVIFGYVQLYEATAQAGRKAEELESMQQQNQLLRSEYEGRIDLAEIEKRAVRELGMTQPTAAQTVYVDLVSADRAEIMEKENVNKVAEAVEVLKSSIENLVSYLF